LDTYSLATKVLRTPNPRATETGWFPKKEGESKKFSISISILENIIKIVIENQISVYRVGQYAWISALPYPVAGR
jgi:hypothetical protein